MNIREANVALRRGMIGSGQYIDPIRRERARYLAGIIDVEEFERRVERLLAGEAPKP